MRDHAREVRGDGMQVEQRPESSGGNDAEVVIDLVGENGTTAEGLAMTRPAGDHHVVGHGQNIDAARIAAPDRIRHVPWQQTVHHTTGAHP